MKRPYADHPQFSPFIIDKSPIRTTAQLIEENFQHDYPDDPLSLLWTDNINKPTMTTHSPESSFWPGAKMKRNFNDDTEAIKGDSAPSQNFFSQQTHRTEPDSQLRVSQSQSSKPKKFGRRLEDEYEADQDEAYTHISVKSQSITPTKSISFLEKASDKTEGNILDYSRRDERMYSERRDVYQKSLIPTPVKSISGIINSTFADDRLI